MYLRSPWLTNAEDGAILPLTVQFLTALLPHCCVLPCGIVPHCAACTAGSLLKEAIEDLEWPGSAVAVKLTRDPPAISLTAHGTGSLEVNMHGQSCSIITTRWRALSVHTICATCTRTANLWLCSAPKADYHGVHVDACAHVGVYPQCACGPYQICASALPRDGACSLVRVGCTARVVASSSKQSSRAC